MTRLVRVAAVGDVHCGKGSQGVFQPLFARMAESADVLVLCGDLTDYGLPDEARVLAREVSARAKCPSSRSSATTTSSPATPTEIAAILTDAGIRVLDGDGVEIQGVGFAGVKGFAGGFGARALQSWGEDVHEALRPRSGGRGAEAGGGPGATLDGAARRDPALCADPRHGRHRAAGDHPVPRLEPPRGAAQPLPRGRGGPRPLARRRAGRADHDRRPGLQRRLAGAETGVSRSSAVPPARDSVSQPRPRRRREAAR